MPNALTTTSRTWAQATDRFWTRGRSTDLQAIDTALANYETLIATNNPWNSAPVEQSLIALKQAIVTWKNGRAVKANGNIASKRDSNGAVSRFIIEIDGVLNSIAANRPAVVPPRPSAQPPGALTPQQRQQASQQQARAANVERDEGNKYEKVNGQWVKKVFSQEQANSCTCACACTYASELAGLALQEEVFRRAYDDVTGRKNDFQINGSLFPPIADALVKLGVDALHTPTSAYPQLKTGLERATPDQPVMFGVYWTGTRSGHAVICKGPGTVRDSKNNTHRGFLIEDPWPDHELAMMYEDGSFWVHDKKATRWVGATAAHDAGFISGKKGRLR